MAKGGKSVLEKQLQIYGGIQKTLRGMSKEEHDKYSPQGTDGYDRHQRVLSNEKEMHAEREKEITMFEKENKPMFGSLATLTKDDVAVIAQLSSKYKDSRMAFVKELDERLEKKYKIKLTK